eukprot:2464056-Rhodomonas_salina.4
MALNRIETLTPAGPEQVASNVVGSGWLSRRGCSWSGAPWPAWDSERGVSTRKSEARCWTREDARRTRQSGTSGRESWKGAYAEEVCVVLQERALHVRDVDTQTETATAHAQCDFSTLDATRPAT